MRSATSSWLMRITLLVTGWSLSGSGECCARPSADPEETVEATDKPLPLPTGSWQVTATQANGAVRNGTLFVTESDEFPALGYFYWKASAGYQATIETVRIYPTNDGESIILWALQTRSVGAPSVPAIYEAGRGATGDGLEPVGHLTELNDDKKLPWTAKWKTARIPRNAVAEAAAACGLDARSMALQCLSDRYRIKGTEVWDYPSRALLVGMLDYDDEFLKGICERRLRLEDLRSKLAEVNDWRDLADEFSVEVKRIALKQVKKWFAGHESDFADAAEILARGGAVDQAYDRQFTAVAISLMGYAGEQDLREFLRSSFSAPTEGGRVFEAAELVTAAVPDGKNVYLQVTNETGVVLRNVVLSSEFHMNLDKVEAQVKAEVERESGLGLTAVLLGADPEMIAKVARLTQAKGTLLAAPAGKTVYLRQWDPGVTVEFLPGPTMLGLMECAEDGLLWVGCDQGIGLLELDLPGLKEPIFEWARRGRPARKVTTASRIYRPQDDAPEDVKKDRG